MYPWLKLYNMTSLLHHCYSTHRSNSQTQLQKLDPRWVDWSGVAATEHTYVLLFKQVSNLHLTCATNTSLQRQIIMQIWLHVKFMPIAI